MAFALPGHSGYGIGDIPGTMKEMIERKIIVFRMQGAFRQAVGMHRQSASKVHRQGALTRESDHGQLLYVGPSGRSAMLDQTPDG